MTGIVERLRLCLEAGESPRGDLHIYAEAADEIQRLRAVLCLCLEAGESPRFLSERAEIEQLRAALQQIADLRYDNTSAATIARRALENKP